jgi:NitT/TauT family transport system substrate-binding protein
MRRLRRASAGTVGSEGSRLVVASRLAVAFGLLLALFARPVLAAEPAAVRVGYLQFGTVEWELDTIRQHGLDVADGIRLEPVALASNEAAKVALEAGAVDLILTDWPYVTRQRAEGADFAFVPASKAVGALLVPPGSPIAGLRDLRGKQIGVAGGPLDKSWLLLRALSRKETGADLAEAAQPVFGAPPLLSEQLRQGRIDAVLTYWTFAARLQASGARPILTVNEVIRRLGAQTDVPMLGYAFHEAWATAHPEALAGFLEASFKAKRLIAGSDADWQRLLPKLGTDNPSVVAALREGYRSGILEQWGEPERRDAAHLYAILVEIGGAELVGAAKAVTPGTFWPSSAP